MFSVGRPFGLVATKTTDGSMGPAVLGVGFCVDNGASIVLQAHLCGSLLTRAFGKRPCVVGEERVSRFSPRYRMAGFDLGYPCLSTSSTRLG